MSEKAPQTVEEVHQIILNTAASIANRMFFEAQDITQIAYRPGERFNHEARARRGGMVSGQIFRADPIQSKKGGLCLSLDRATTEGKTQSEIDELHAIGVAAIKESIVSWHPELFAGVILGEAKSNRNYFNRFNDKRATESYQQDRLFDIEDKQQRLF